MSHPDNPMINTVNPEEIEKFSKLSAKWWSPHSPLDGLRRMNGIRVPLIESTINKKIPGKKRILDIGSGGGFLSEALGERFHSLGYSDEEIQIIGLEPAFSSVRVARAHLPPQLAGKVSYLCDTIENYVTLHPKDEFDTVVMSEVIEHVDNPKEFLKYAVSLVKPGGSIILTTHGKTFLSWFVGIFLAEYVSRVLPIGTHEYKKFISLSDCLQMLEENECENKDVRGMVINPITRAWKWSKYKSLWYSIHSIKRNNDISLFPINISPKGLKNL